MRGAIEALFHSRPPILDLRGARNVLQYLARPLVGAHLQADGGLVHGGLNLNFGVIEVSPGAVRIHAHLTGTLVGPHLKTKAHNKKKKKESRQEEDKTVPVSHSIT